VKNATYGIHMKDFLNINCWGKNKYSLQPLIQTTRVEDAAAATTLSTRLEEQFPSLSETRGNIVDIRAGIGSSWKRCRNVDSKSKLALAVDENWNIIVKFKDTV
jgi:hypothetical protein